jgi:hypothetical protein
MMWWSSFESWLETTWVPKVVLGLPWTWPLLETLHFLALCLLLGSLIIMDLRLIGFQRVIPLKAVHALMPVALGSFAVNLITGLGFYISVPQMYSGNWAFVLKMILILFAGLNFLFYYFKVEPTLMARGPNEPTPALAKALGVASLLLWSGVLSLGRLLPYLGIGGG